jgi:hypothetical protein
MTQSASDLISEMGRFYPGSKQERKGLSFDKPSASDKEIEVWDARPIIKRLKSGNTVELFPIGSLATALRRDSVRTVRFWESKGYIPKAPYRTQPRANEVDKSGLRLYSRAMIEAAVRLFTQHGVIDKPRIEWNNHHLLSLAVKDAWSDIKASEATPAKKN